MSEKAAIQCFVGKHAALSFIAPKISFGQLATKLSFFELYIAKTSVFTFSWVQHVPLSFMPSKERVSLSLAQLHCLQYYLSQNNLCHISLHEIPFLRANLSKICFGAFAASWGWFELCVTSKERFFACVFKYASFSYIAKKTCFGLCAVELRCFQRYCTGKKFPGSLP